MKYFSIFLFLISISTTGISQSNEEKISIEKAFGGYKYLQNGRQLRMAEMVSIVKVEDLAYTKMQSAKSNTTMASILGAAGGLLIGWPIGSAIAGGEPNWTLAIVGAGLIVVSIPISIKGNNQATEAVNIYNASLDKQAYNNSSTQVRFSINSNGVGFVLKF